MKDMVSTYGWIIILTLVLSVMLAFATPFGIYVGRGVVSVLRSSNQTLNNSYENFEKQQQEYMDMFNSKIVKYKEAGLYETNSSYSKMECDWKTLIKEEAIILTMYADGTVRAKTNYEQPTGKNDSIAYLEGEVVLKSGINAIEEYGFAGCSLMTSINIKDVETIDSYAFLNCYQLKTVVIDKQTITQINTNAFANCQNLKEIYYNGTWEQFEKINIEPQGITQEITVICSDTIKTVTL